MKRWSEIQKNGLYPRRDLWLTGNVALAYHKAKARAKLENDKGVIVEVDFDCAGIPTILRVRRHFILLKKKIPPACLRQFGPTIRI